MPPFARKDQFLSDHLQETALLAKKFGSVYRCENTAYYAGLLHDMGKYSTAFQKYLERSINGEKTRRGEVIHALQGAKYVSEWFNGKNSNDLILSDILGNIIASHHNGLFDDIYDGKRMLSFKCEKSEEKLSYTEIKEKFTISIDVKKINDEILAYCKICQKHNLNLIFMLHLLTKGLYSCLVDADRCNSAGLKLNDDSPQWDEAIQKLERYLSEFSVERAIDLIRQEISYQCKTAGKRQQGTYTLSLPTGAGKTLSSLRFALEHAREHRLKRIIYVIPYLSILDQTASELRKVFGTKADTLILEHHSNMELPEDVESADDQKLLSSRWDSPIILTTMVQFLETIYSNKASKLRKFHNMTDSVLVFDEVQSVPIKCVHLFNDAVNFLNVFGRSSVVLCTATQPHLHKTERPVFLTDQPELVQLSEGSRGVFKRVQVEDKSNDVNSFVQIAKLAEEQIKSDKSTLIILNTKRSAQQIYEACQNIECKKVFLTTDLCPAHRMALLDQLRKNLKPECRKLTLCVSTQLIEAGVDISFDCVIRSKAGLDSIVQAAGRCNRNGEKSEAQTLYVVNVIDEKLSRLPEILEGKNITSRVFREKEGAYFLGEDVVSLFYKYYFYEQKIRMDFNTINERSTVYNLLSENSIGQAAYRGRQNGDSYTGLPCAFESAANEFSVIDSTQTGVVVPYGDALQLVSQFEQSYNPMEKVQIMKKLQKYTVSVYDNVLNGLIEQRAMVVVRDVEKSFYLLSPDYYDKDRGLQREALYNLLCI